MKANGAGQLLELRSHREVMANDSGFTPPGGGG